MKRVYPEAIGDLMRKLVESENMQPKLDERKAVQIWPSIIGRHLAAITGRPDVRNGVMSVSVPSAPLRQELHASRSQLVNAINEAIGRPTLSDIRFTS